MGLFEILKIIFPLLLIIALLGGLLFLVKKIQFKGAGLIHSNVKIIYTLMLIPKKYLSFVKINDKILVLGVSEQNINLIKEINANEFQLNSDYITEQESFREQLKNFLRR
jgi:flagellar protein FliO/FliZ